MIDLISSVNDYKKILRSTPDLYLILNNQLVIVDVSDAYLKATMTKRSDIIGKNVFTAFTDDPLDTTATGVNNLNISLHNVLKYKISDTMAVQKYSLKVPNESGGGFEIRYWSPINTPVLDELGNVKYIIHRVEDVTSYVNWKEKESRQDELTVNLKNKAMQMEHEIYQRAKEIQETNKKLRLQKEIAENFAKKAEEASEHKVQFLANMSHELRTPLNAIIGFSQLMFYEKAGALSETQKEYLGEILVSSQHLLNLINEVLELTTIEAGNMVFYPAQINVKKVTEEVLSTLKNFQNSKNIKCSIHIDKLLPPIVLDKIKLKQVIYNYLTNAFKFTPEKGQVKIRFEYEANGKFKFQVDDNGIGINEKDIPKLFQFEQLDSGSSKKYQGIGLGLALTRRIVEAQGGIVGVKSKLGGGSSFYAILPCVHSIKEKIRSETKPNNLFYVVKET